MQWKQYSLCVFTTLLLRISKITTITVLWNCSVTYIRHYVTNNLAFPTCSLETNTYPSFRNLPLALKVYIFWKATNRGLCHLWRGFWNLLERFKIKKVLGNHLQGKKQQVNDNQKSFKWRPKKGTSQWQYCLEISIYDHQLHDHPLYAGQGLLWTTNRVLVLKVLTVLGEGLESETLNKDIVTITSLQW